MLYIPVHLLPKATYRCYIFHTGTQVYYNATGLMSQRLYLCHVFCVFSGLSDNKDDGSLRLVDGVSPHDGRVEVFHFGQWGTVHSDSWGLLDAIVVCRQLDYPSAIAPKSFSCGNISNWLSSVQCTGFEANLTQCRTGRPTLHSCWFGNAGVNCSGEWQCLKV